MAASAIASGTAVLIAVDDVQWADPQSVRILEFALLRFASPGLHVLLAMLGVRPAASSIPILRGIDEWPSTSVGKQSAPFRRRGWIGCFGTGSRHRSRGRRSAAPRDLRRQPVLTPLSSRARSWPARHRSCRTRHSRCPCARGPARGSTGRVSTCRHGPGEALALALESDLERVASVMGAADPVTDLAAVAMHEGILQTDHLGRYVFSHPMLRSEVDADPAVATTGPARSAGRGGREPRGSRPPPRPVDGRT